MAPLPMFHRPLSLDNSRDTSLSSGRGGATTGPDTSAESAGGLSLPVMKGSCESATTSSCTISKQQLVCSVPDSSSVANNLVGPSDYMVPLAGGVTGATQSQDIIKRPTANDVGGAGSKRTPANHVHRSLYYYKDGQGSSGRGYSPSQGSPSDASEDNNELTESLLSKKCQKQKSLLQQESLLHQDQGSSRESICGGKQRRDHAETSFSCSPGTSRKPRNGSNSQGSKMKKADLRLPREAIEPSGIDDTISSGYFQRQQQQQLSGHKVDTSMPIFPPPPSLGAPNLNGVEPSNWEPGMKGSSIQWAAAPPTSDGKSCPISVITNPGGHPYDGDGPPILGKAPYHKSKESARKVSSGGSQRPSLPKSNYLPVSVISTPPDYPQQTLPCSNCISPPKGYMDCREDEETFAQMGLLHLHPEESDQLSIILPPLPPIPDESDNLPSKLEPIIGKDLSGHINYVHKNGAGMLASSSGGSPMLYLPAGGDNNSVTTTTGSIISSSIGATGSEGSSTPMASPPPSSRIGHQQQQQTSGEHVSPTTLGVRRSPPSTFTVKAPSPSVVSLSPRGPVRNTEAPPNEISV